VETKVDWLFMHNNFFQMFHNYTIFNRMTRLGVVSVLSFGCSLGDSDLSECRCSPTSNTVLFPHCSDVIASVDQETTNPFATQTPECPSGKQLFLLQRTRPEYALINVRTIFSAQPESRNPEQYLEQLTEDFVFIPDLEDIARYPNIYKEDKEPIWTIENERDFVRAILDPDRIGTIRFVRWFQPALDERIPSEDQVSETFIFPYELEFTEISNADGEEINSVVSIAGFMEVDFITPTVENPVWNISQWRDVRDRASAKFSWGELRAIFSR
tara:strand:- start:94 stop:906 length:813 start_codon:yes stop_codon:yes gene_type:complete